MPETTYTKTISVDFTSGVNLALFHAEIAASSIAQTCNGVTDNSVDSCLITFADALSAGDQTTLDNLVSAHDPTGFEFQENYLEQTVSKGKVTNDSWYAVDDAGTLKYKVREVAYAYSGQKLTSETETVYDEQGGTVSTTTHDWETDGNLRRKKVQ